MNNINMPQPTISRNDQNIGATIGMVSVAACLICSGVASITFGVYFFSSRPCPRSSLRLSNSRTTSGLLSPARSFSSAP